MIVLPMAGLSSRFFKAGYTVPKYMLDLHGHSVFAHAICSFSSLFGVEKFIIICRDSFDTPSFVRSQCAQLGLESNQVEVVVLKNETAGQAQTVAEGINMANLGNEEFLTIFNIDTFRPDYRHPPELSFGKIDGFLEVFYGQGDHWSFVRPLSGTNKVVEVTEKIRISNLCSTGLYYFRSIELFLSLFGEIERMNPADLQGGEYYVAPLYNSAIKRGLDIRYNVVPTDEIFFCGTPDEYQYLQNRQPLDYMDIHR